MQPLSKFARLFMLWINTRAKIYFAVVRFYNIETVPHYICIVE